MSIEQNARPAIFVDRDGTMIEEVDHLSAVEELRIYPFTAEALDLFKAAGYLVIVVTNQSGIGRGYFTLESMHRIHEQIRAELGTRIDGFYFCPHHPDAGCQCRKPNLGMIEAACRDLEIDLARSWMVGDKTIDVETGHNAGIGTALVLTGYGSGVDLKLLRTPDFVTEDLLHAARMITEAV